MSPRSIGNHPLQIGLVSCAVQMYTAIDSHDRKGHMFHHHPADDTYSPVKMPKVCEGCGAAVTAGDIDTGYDQDGEVVIMTDADKKALEKSSGAAIEIVRFIRAKEVQPLMFSGEKAYYLTPDVDKKRGSKQGTATYKSIVRELEEEGLCGVVQYTKWGKTRIGLLRVEPTDDGGCLVIQNMIWPDELRAPELPAQAKDIEPDPRLLPVMRSVVESMTEDWNSEDYRDVYQEQLTAAIEAKAAGKPIELTDEQDAPTPDDIDALLAALQASQKKKAPAKKAPAKKRSVA